MLWTAASGQPARLEINTGVVIHGQLPQENPQSWKYKHDLLYMCTGASGQSATLKIETGVV